MVFDPPVKKDVDDRWGPPPGASLNFLPQPFEASAKPEKLGRVCDFTYLTFQRAQKEGRVAVEETADFRLVDSRPVKNPYNHRGRYTRRPFNQQRQMHGNFQHRNTQGGRETQQRGGKQGQQRGGYNNWNRGGNWGQGGYRQRTLAEWSMEPAPDWEVMAEIMLPQLPKQKVDYAAAKIEDIEWRGELFQYQKEYDRILPKQAIALRDYRKVNDPKAKLEFYQTASLDDEILTSALEMNDKVTVVATDHILSYLMAAAMSKQSWHLSVVKVDGKIILDKTDRTSVVLDTVGENARDPPAADNATKINRPYDLSLEAMRVNQDFQQQVLKTSGPAVADHGAAPFVSAEHNPAKKLYRYRLVTLPGKPNASTEFGKKAIGVLTRGEIDGVVPGAESGQGYLTIRAFNEYDFRSGKPWRVLIENQKGGLFASENRDNACKLAKWTAQALIGGCEHMRLGFISRSSPNNNMNHEILFVQSHLTTELAEHIGMKPEMAWGQVRYIIDLIGALEDGQYNLIKDPMKAVARLYRPPGTDVEGEVEGFGDN
eukprot:Lankesteria_metandrocarpae@DN9264_c0_g1_i1.p1